MALFDKGGKMRDEGSWFCHGCSQLRNNEMASLAMSSMKEEDDNISREMERKRRR